MSYNFDVGKFSGYLCSKVLLMLSDSSVIQTYGHLCTSPAYQLRS